MFSAIASLQLYQQGASKFLGSATGGGKGSRVKTPEFSKKQAKAVSRVPNTETEDIKKFKEFHSLGTAGQVASLISGMRV